MPKYEYACKSCGEHTEVVQSFADAPLSECPVCGGPLRKVFSPPGIAFKGSGFYRTDNRKRRTEPKSDVKADAASGSEAKSDGKAEPAKKDGGGSSTGSPAATPAASSSSEAKPKAAEAKTA